MATEPQPCIDILAGRFIYTDQDGVQHTAEFYVRTCLLPEQFDAPGWGEAQAKREDDLTEQYEEVAVELTRLYGSASVHYTEVSPNPFF